jgi:hypothetical protein
MSVRFPDLLSDSSAVFLSLFRRTYSQYLEKALVSIKKIKFSEVRGHAVA